LPKLVFADGIIPNGGSGSVLAATGSVGSETESTTSMTVHNSSCGVVLDGTLFYVSKYAAESTDGTWQCLPFPQVYQAKATGTIPRGDSGDLELYTGGTPAVDGSGDRVIVTGWYDWGEGENIESSNEVYVAWSYYEQLWRIRCP
jgi:hypothetical protein